MTLRLYNTLTRKLENFVPLRNEVGIYSCGLTVQAPPHLGHLKAAITRDILVRWLRHLGYKVKTIENFTDVDDRIIEKQKQTKEDWRIIAQRNIDEYFSACDSLNILRADYYPKASQHIEEIIDLIQRLLENGLAYIKGGDVYYRVRKFSGYGRLSTKSIDELQVGARIEPTESKEDPLDFTLWKAAKPDEPFWLSPWGKGRPGWHIECSAMSMHYLGESFDIHTGGEDLIFPHHENEIAQSVGATGKEFVHYWLHNGLLNLTGEKMSKSTGHYFLISDILKDFAPSVIRLFLLKTQYRSPSDFSRERLEEAHAAYTRIMTYLERPSTGTDQPIENHLLYDRFAGAMNDDLNTPEAIGVIFELVRMGYEHNDLQIGNSIRYYLQILGFSKDQVKTDDVSSRLIELILELRTRARLDKNYKLSDEIRVKLKDMGIVVDDAKEASIYRRLESAYSKDEKEVD